MAGTPPNKPNYSQMMELLAKPWKKLTEDGTHIPPTFMRPSGAMRAKKHEKDKEAMAALTADEYAYAAL